MHPPLCRIEARYPDWRSDCLPRRTAFGQLMRLPQVAKVQYRCCVRVAVVSKFEARALMLGVIVLQRLLEHRVAQHIPVPKEVYAQHHFQRIRWPYCLRVMWPDQSQHRRPRHNYILFGEELFTPRLYLLRRMAASGEGRLLGHLRVLLSFPQLYPIPLSARRFSDRN